MFCEISEGWQDTKVSYEVNNNKPHCKSMYQVLYGSHTDAKIQFFL